ncbi:hypothetical protein ACE1B6_06650 [Aerosakkonemataceae cyanobacterium BLCC-F154]|uniref:Inactive STAND domain-containing protein n=1 Tax=Floridaenema fluviatile BLCC-F154 TaxID=3153640 RepID=A0ABV4Y7Z5_9CYAN
MQDVINNLNLIEPKEKRLQLLYNQFYALYAQLNTERNNAHKISIEEDIKQKEAEINNLKAEIKRLRELEIGSDRLYRNYCNTWEEKIPKIDFSKANAIVDHIFKKIKNQEGAALFVLQNSRSMGGDWCITNIKSQLQNIGILYSPGKYEFLAHQQANQIDFLNFLAQKFKYEPYTGAPSRFIDELIEKICSSLCSGNILFIQVDIYSLDSQNQFLSWFLKEFWCPLVRQLPEISQQHRLVRFVAVLSVGDLIEKDCLPDVLYCKKTKFDREKFLELPLQKWEQKHIEDWLFSFSELTSPPIRCTSTQIEEMARRIHKVTKGEPNQVYNQLMDQMTKLVNEIIRN